MEVRGSDSYLPIGGYVVALAGCAGLVIGPFLPWASAVMVSANGLQKTGNEAIILIALGLAGIAAGVTSLAQKSNRFFGIYLLAGIVGLGFSIYYNHAISDQLSGAQESSILPLSVGAGVYVSIVASIVALVGGLIIVIAGREKHEFEDVTKT